MELLVTDTQGIPEDSILSVRAGATRRQAPATPAQPFKFPTGPDEANPFKVDVLAPIGGARLILKPGEERYTIPIQNEGEEGSLRADGPMSITLAVKENTESDGKRTGVSPAKRHTQASAARTYLDEHNLVEFAQSLLQSVIKEKPEHPYTFMAKQFHLPDPKPRPNTCPPVLPTPVARRDFAGQDIARLSANQFAAPSVKAPLPALRQPLEPSPAPPQAVQEPELPARGEEILLEKQGVLVPHTAPAKEAPMPEKLETKAPPAVAATATMPRQKALDEQKAAESEAHQKATEPAKAEYATAPPKAPEKSYVEATSQEGQENHMECNEQPPLPPRPAPVACDEKLAVAPILPFEKVLDTSSLKSGPKLAEPELPKPTKAELHIEPPAEMYAKAEPEPEMMDQEAGDATSGPVSNRLLQSNDMLNREVDNLREDFLRLKQQNEDLRKKLAESGVRFDQHE